MYPGRRFDPACVARSTSYFSTCPHQPLPSASSHRPSDICSIRRQLQASIALAHPARALPSRPPSPISFGSRHPLDFVLQPLKARELDYEIENNQQLQDLSEGEIATEAKRLLVDDITTDLQHATKTKSILKTTSDQDSYKIGPSLEINYELN